MDPPLYLFRIYFVLKINMFNQRSWFGVKSSNINFRHFFLSEILIKIIYIYIYAKCIYLFFFLLKLHLY